MVLRAFSRWVERQHKKVVDKMEATWNDIVQGIDDDNQLTEADEMFHPVMAAKKQWESAANVKAAASGVEDAIVRLQGKKEFEAEALEKWEVSVQAIFI